MIGCLIRWKSARVRLGMLSCALMGLMAMPVAWGQEEVVFQDEFDGAAGSTPNGAKWTVVGKGEGAALDGAGNLVLTGSETWNAAGVESVFTIPGRGEAVYEIEYRVSVPEAGAHYIGLTSAAGAVGPTNHRAFFLQGAGPAYSDPGKINLTTSQSGKGSGALSSDMGIGSDGGQYVTGKTMGLSIRLNANGTLEWASDQGDGYKGIKANAGTKSDQRMLAKWTRGPGAQYRVHLQANGWQAADKRLLVDRVTVTRLPTPKQSDAGYVADVNQILQYGDQGARATTGPALMQSYESPTGSGIWYARKEIEPVPYPGFDGDYYQAKVPATLDLAERGALAVHCITQCADPAADYEIFGWLGNLKSGKATLKHTYHDFNGGQAKWMRQLPAARTMSGSTQAMDVDVKMMEGLYRMLGPGGLYYIPVKGMSWVGKPDSVTPWTEPGVEQVYDVGPNGRALLCMAVWYARNPQDQALKKNIENMIDGFLKIAIRKDGALWLPRHFYDGNAPEDEGCPTGGTAVTTQSTLQAGAALYYAMTGYPPAREFCEMSTKYWLGPAHILKENGEWDWGGPGTHFHGTTMALIGLMEWAKASRDQELMKRIKEAYEFGRSIGEPTLGWYPEGHPASHPNTEPCGIGDMVVLGTMLSEAGMGDYWEDVEHTTRNLLAASQVTDGSFVERIAAQHPGNEALEKGYETADNVAQRMVGSFNGMTGTTGFFQTVASCCCTGNGNQGLYYAWRSILAEREGELRVNLLLNRASQWGDVNSYLPNEGRVDVMMKRDEVLKVRIPSWVTDPATVKCRVDGKGRDCTWQERYLVVGNVKKGEKASIEFPLLVGMVKRTTKWNENGQPREQEFTLSMRGFTVVDISPRADNVIFPFFTDEGARQDKVAWKNVKRFAPNQERYW